jgi:hypothetical protein
VAPFLFGTFSFLGNWNSNMADDIIATFECRWIGRSDRWELRAASLRYDVKRWVFFRRQLVIPLSRLRASSAEWNLRSDWFFPSVSVLGIGVMAWICGHLFSMQWMQGRSRISIAVGAITVPLTALLKRRYIGIGGVPPVYIQYRTHCVAYARRFVEQIVAQIRAFEELERGSSQP